MSKDLAGRRCPRCRCWNVKDAPTRSSATIMPGRSEFEGMDSKSQTGAVCSSDMKEWTCGHRKSHSTPVPFRAARELPGGGYRGWLFVKQFKLV